MKTNVTRRVTQEIEIKTVEIEIPIDEIEEHEPPVPPNLLANFKAGEVWRIQVNIDTGQILGWPDGVPAFRLYAKPRDGGSYRLLGADGAVLAAIEQNYVPNGVVPGDYGDYVDLNIAANGVITNWPAPPDPRAFFAADDS